MQTENISSYSNLTTAGNAAPVDLSRLNPFLSPTTSPTYVNSSASFYSSLFQTYYSRSPTDSASFDGGDTDRRLHDASCILEYQQLYNRYKLCLVQLRDSIEEVESLRRENETLRLSNAELSHRSALLFSRHYLQSDLNRLSIASPSATAPPRTASRLQAAAPQVQSLGEHNRIERRSTDQRVSFPKSIAVRSSGYLKMNFPGGDTASHKPVIQPLAVSQRVYVPGSKSEEDALELDVYNQGMVKTELCNKWEETGACPHGENCQFAHGIKELWPVIRHPRYKTEVCRMVLAGDICPYGSAATSATR